MKALLKPLELAYRGVNRGRRELYRRNVLTSNRLPRPVVSIGNLTVGGSGKTPAVIALCRMLRQRGLAPAILTRGFGRRPASGWSIVDVPDAWQFGDEPVMMSVALDGVPVVVGADRFRSGLGFLAHHDCDLFVLDDGFQHLQLARDCDIVIIRGDSRWKREGASALRDADIILHRGPARRLDGARTFSVELVAVEVELASGVSPLSILQRRPVVAFAGLADNQQFFRTLRRLGAIMSGAFEFTDHHIYTTEEIDIMKRRASELGAILITTRKDWVKLRDPEVGVLDVEMQFNDGDAFVDHVLTLCGIDSAARTNEAVVDSG